MNAKNIKSILVSYLQATYSEVRVYQEKSIGSSICDVMAVTDRLIGFEIKSDLDNYTRLNDQIKAYNLFFDENYLVVGEKHLNSATERVPGDWGIICIKANDVVIVRKPKLNKNVSRRKQLSILWKLELKNLLIKNQMPIYAQKEKSFLAEKITETVESDILRKQIAKELMHRDYSVFDAKDYTLYFKAEENEFPAKELVDTLSERDLSEFTLDKWIELYKQAKEISERKNNLYKKPVERSVPHNITYKDIEVSLGAPWIDKEIVSDFICHILNGDDADNNALSVRNFVNYEKVTGNWYIGNKNYLGYQNQNAEIKYGIKRYNALHIIEATLNLRQIKLYDKNKKFDEKDTLVVLEKQKLIKKEFKNWIWQDADRIWLVEEAYNRMFGGLEHKSYDGEKLKFPDMAENFALYPYQKDAVQKIINSKNTLLAFDVGAGKTFIMIAAAMKMRQEGLSRKNLFVVPNHIVGQWEKIFSELYPKAKILAIEPKVFKPEMRNKVLKQIRDGDYDGIIIAYSCFEMIPLSNDSVFQNMNNQLKILENAVAELQGSYSYIEWSRRTLSQEKSRILKLTQDFVESMNPKTPNGITFDELAINTLFLDEAHNYKNLPIETKMTSNISGINTKGSRKCKDLLHKIRCVQQANNGGGVVFATGTPLCNSIADTYTMQVYLQYEKLQELELAKFDNWVKTFAQPEQLCEIDVDTSKYRFVTRFAKFHNLTELSSLFSQIAIFYANNNIDGLPDFSGYNNVVIKKYEELQSYMEAIVSRTELIRSGIIDKTHDNMLKVSTDGRKAALDLRLVGGSQPLNDSSKIIRCIKNVVEIYKNDKNTTQLIFCDYSTPKKDLFNVYNELKNALIESGVPEKEIAFIHNYKTESRKVELFRKFNNGEVRILIGSTFKLGVGANVQVKLKAIHHLDVPWRPADMVQREGRILRRGNTNENVLIYRYVTEGSFDSYAWQILETKQKFISQFLMGNLYQRTASDLEDSVLSYGEVKALALSEPLMKILAEKENELSNLKVMIAKEKEVREDLKIELNNLCDSILKMEVRHNKVIEMAYILKNTPNDDFLREFHKIESLFTSDVVLKRSALKENVTVLGFKIVLPEVVNEKKPYIFLEARREMFLVEMGESASGNAKRIINTLKRFGKIAEEIQENLAKARKRNLEIKKILQTEDTSDQQKLLLCEAEIEQIKDRMEIFNPETDYHD